MDRTCVFSIDLVVSTILFSQVGCHEQTRVPEESKSALTVPQPALGPGLLREGKGPLKARPEEEPAPKIAFEKVIYDLGEVGPDAKKTCEFKFTNTGDGLLKIISTGGCCGTATTTLAKKEYAPGESGTLKIDYRSGSRPGVMSRSLYVHSNDKTKPRVALTVKATIVERVGYEPKRLNLSLKDENAGCPEITLTSLNGERFSITAFRSTSDCITTDIDPSAQAMKFILQSKVYFERLQMGLRGLIEISLTHPECDKVTIPFNVPSKFRIIPQQIIVLDAEPQRSITREVSVLNNYGEDFKVESVSSESNTVKLLSREKTLNGYQFTVEITPPAAEDKSRIFKDVLHLNIKGGEELEIACRGFYSTKASTALPKFKTIPPQIIVLNAEPNKPVMRKAWVLSNYGEGFELEAVSAKNGLIEIVSQNEIGSGYQFEVKITPPATAGKTRFTDQLILNTKDGEKLTINCHGFYSKKPASESNGN